MKNIFRVLCGVILSGLLLTSCLNTGDDDDVTTYDDMAITAFTLGTLNRYLHTTASTGADSVYKTTYSAATYAMRIDQLGYRIYNADSLPTGTDLAHVVCTVSTRNGGLVFLRSTTSDSLTYFSSGADSVDFTVPRVFSVYATDGSGSRDYTVTLNARSQAAGQLLWTMMAAGTPLPQTPAAGWQFALNAADTTITATADNWATTIPQTYDTDRSLLPTANAAFASWLLAKGLTYALLVGDSDSQPTAAVVWRRIIDGERPTDWVFLPLAEDNSYYLPKGHRYWLLPYTGGSVLAVDETGYVYRSYDQGITWRHFSGLNTPVATVADASTDGQGGIWLQDAEGAVWYGHMTD